MNSVLENVCLICNEVRNETSNGATFQTLMAAIRRSFRRHGIEISFKTKNKKFLQPEEFYVNAYYDAEDDLNKDVAIEVITYHNFDKTTVWDRKHITDMLIQIYDAVVHEHKHQRQSRRRNYKSYWMHVDAGYHYQDYLADPDEVDAYAFSIAIELCRNLGKYRAIRYMPKFSALSRIKIQDCYVSPNLHAYVSHFGSVDGHLIRNLAKKVYVRLQKIDTDFIFV